MKGKILVVLLATVLIVSCKEEVIINSNELIFEQVFSYDAPTSARYAQGMDIFHGDVFQGFSDGTIQVFSLLQNRFVQSLGPLYDEKGKILHMNDITFKKMEDKVLLIIPGNDINSKIVLFTVSIDKNGLYHLEKDFEMNAPSIDSVKYKAATQFFGSGNTMVQVAYKRTANDGFGDSLIEGYVIDEFGPSIHYERKWSTEHRIMWAMQGAAFNGENCFLAVGVPHGDAKIYKIDATTGSVICFIDFRQAEDTLKDEEMQGIAFYDGLLYFSTTYGMYKVL